MSSFGPAAVLGLIFGFLWGIGCSLAIMYSIFLGGYRRAIKESVAEPQPDRYKKAFAKIQGKRIKKAANR
ncbi:MAG TPA: hypothetical protein VG225_03525 [Terracidiphilus sp.]|jgi:hypothetical protein|nr:hypothetical protein [Terracidiphilus sp.]